MYTYVLAVKVGSECIYFVLMLRSLFNTIIRMFILIRNAGEIKLIVIFSYYIGT